LKRVIHKGDILYIQSLDRFDRNKEEILQEWNAFQKIFRRTSSFWIFIADLVCRSFLGWNKKYEIVFGNGNVREFDVALQNGKVFCGQKFK
jgi:hypothetical protein